MPPVAKIPGLDAGTRVEVRVAQAWFWDGYYVRRGVDLYHRYGDDISNVTDLDVLGVSLDAALVPHRQIGEVKSGTSKNTPRPLDRALWMRGLRELVAAERGEVTTAFRTSGSTRDACRRLGVTVQHLDDLAERETRLHVSDFEDMGAQGDSIALLRGRVQAFVKTDAVLERGYWFLISEVWFLEPFDALKRTLGLLRQLSKSWPPESHQQATEAARWFFAEALSIATLNLAVVAGQANTMDARAFTDMANAALATGDVPVYAMRALSERIDEYVGKLLTSVKAPAEILATAMGAFRPAPPDYAEPLIELVSRLAHEAGPTSRLPRQLDTIIFERLVRQREVTPQLRARLGVSATTERQSRLIAAFFRGQLKIPSAVDEVLTRSLLTDEAAGITRQPPALFDGVSGTTNTQDIAQHATSPDSQDAGATEPNS